MGRFLDEKKRSAPYSRSIAADLWRGAEREQISIQNVRFRETLERTSASASGAPSSPARRIREGWLRRAFAAGASAQMGGAEYGNVAETAG
jgi:hypothetical protein